MDSNTKGSTAVLSSKIVEVDSSGHTDQRAVPTEEAGGELSPTTSNGADRELKAKLALRKSMRYL